MNQISPAIKKAGDLGLPSSHVDMQNGKKLVDHITDCKSKLENSSAAALKNASRESDLKALTAAIASANDVSISNL